MTKLLNALLSISLILLLYSCEFKVDVIEKMEEIKCVGDKNPEKAIDMLDSLTVQIREESEYAKKKYDLLKIRLNDKAFIKHTNDITIKNILPYFEDNGSIDEKQEAYYYAGSVYRDLQDTPRALNYFHHSEELAENNPECDSIMLRNTYSQIHVLLYSVQDYKKAYEYALKEYDISEKINKIDLTALNHVGISYFCLDSLAKAKMWFDIELDSISKQPDFSKYEDNIYSLLYNYSLMKDIEKSTICYNLSKTLKSDGVYTDKYIALGEYYTLIGKADSAIMCFKQRVSVDNSLRNRYDSTKSLFRLYFGKRAMIDAANYANLFLQVSDSLDLGKRQELAATVNNQFQYHLDKNNEIKLIKDKEENGFWLATVVMGTFLLFTILSLLTLYRKNCHLKETVRLSELAHKYKNDNKKLQKEIENWVNEIKKNEMELARTKEDLILRNEELKTVQTDFKEKEKELELNKSVLEEKIEQNKSLLSLIHKTELENSAKDVLNDVKNASKGLKNMNASEWKQLYAAVDELYPDFPQLLIENCGHIDEQKMKLCYLMKIGLSNNQILNITGLPRTTAYRWKKQFNWIVQSDDKE